MTHANVMAESGDLSLGEWVYRRARRIAKVFALTPLHPQWFSFLGKNRAIRQICREAGGSLLDIGCGDGRLGRMWRGDRYVGLDHPATGAAWYGARPHVFADAACLPFMDASFDHVALLDVLEHLPEPRVALREIARILKHGGKLFINVPYLYPLHDEPCDYQRLTAHGLSHWLQDAGFDVIEIKAVGAPAETVALLFNIAIASMVAHAVKAFPPAVLLVLLFGPLVPVINLAGWILGRVAREDCRMPFAYWCIARRRSLVPDPAL